MFTPDTVDDLETEDCTDMGLAIEPIARSHNLLTLAELLEDDIRVSLRLRAVGINARNGNDGCEVILFGRFAAGAMQGGSSALPAEIDVAFGADGRIRRMTIAVVDPQALTAAIRDTAQEGALVNF